MAGKYLELLMKWQRAHRLVGSIETGWLIDNVLLDSIAFLAGIPEGAASIVDIGSGAGVPGIPIAIVKRDTSVSLVEARGRRASFLSAVIRELQLDRAGAIHSRVEDLRDEYRGRFDVAVMRCAGPIGSVLTGAMRLVSPGGTVLVAAPPVAVGALDENTALVTVETARGIRAFRRYYKPRDSGVDR
jgi:16S rRNA (guanine527-N7)-methyltransferase